MAYIQNGTPSLALFLFLLLAITRVSSVSATLQQADTGYGAGGDRSGYGVWRGGGGYWSWGRPWVGGVDGGGSYGSWRPWGGGVSEGGDYRSVGEGDVGQGGGGGQGGYGGGYGSGSGYGYQGGGYRVRNTYLGGQGGGGGGGYGSGYGSGSCPAGQCSPPTAPIAFAIVMKAVLLHLWASAKLSACLDFYIYSFSYRHVVQGRSLSTSCLEVNAASEYPFVIQIGFISFVVSLHGRDLFFPL